MTVLKDGWILLQTNCSGPERTTQLRRPGQSAALAVATVGVCTCCSRQIDCRLPVAATDLTGNPADRLLSVCI